MTMPRTRKSISVRGAAYRRLADHCAKKGVSLSGQVEEWVAEALDRAGVPAATADDVAAEQERVKSEKERIKKKREKEDLKKKPPGILLL